MTAAEWAGDATRVDDPRALMTAAPVATISLDPTGRVRMWNDAAHALLQWSPTEATGRLLTELTSAAGEDLAADLTAAAAGRSLRRSYVLGRRDRSVVDVDAWLAPVRDRDANVAGVVIQLIDVAPRSAGSHDPLTHMPNRQALLAHLDELAAGESKPRAVLLLDLDDFRLVNDAHGQDVGDQLLQVVAERLRLGVGREHYVARFGVDEFVAVLTEVADPAALSERLLAAIAAPIDIAGVRLAVTASAGLAASPPTSLADALRNADASMYEAKRQGRARLHAFDQSAAARASSMLHLAAALRLALYDDPAQLDVHYQPIVTLDSNLLIAVEALARWRHPELGPIPPGRFVDVAQQTGLAARLDVLTMQRSFRDHAELIRRRAVDSATRIAVNVAAAHLADGNIGDEILRASYEAGLMPRQLMIEVGDHAVLRDVDVARKALERLQAQGALIVLDEFGAGLSSLTSLRQLPVDVLKIDRVFVRNLAADSEDLAIVAALIDLAHALGVTVVAEGVETPAQRQLLVELGCDQAQGYLWSAPVPCDELPDALAELVSRSRAADAIGQLRPRPAAGMGVVGRAHGLLRMLELRREGRSAATIAAALNAEGYRTPEGVRWHRGTVARALVAAMECPD